MMDLIRQLFDWLVNAVVAILQLLPESPIQKVTADPLARDVCGYLNYFFPVGWCMDTMAAVLSATLIWYAVRWLLRFARYVQ